VAVWAAGITGLSGWHCRAGLRLCGVTAALCVVSSSDTRRGGEGFQIVPSKSAVQVATRWIGIHFTSIDIQARTWKSTQLLLARIKMRENKATSVGQISCSWKSTQLLSARFQAHRNQCNFHRWIWPTEVK
jgi:hypothetical protein